MGRARFKDYNLGAAIPLLKGETCVAWAQHRVDPVSRFVRMRLADSGEAERAEYEMRPREPHSFHHRTALVPAASVTGLQTALEAALREARGDVPDPDPEAVYWKLIIWHDGGAAEIPLQMEWGRPTRPAPAFAAAWSSLASLFGVTPVLGELAWVP